MYSRKDKDGVDIREWLKADIRSSSPAVASLITLLLRVGAKYLLFTS